MKNVKIYVAHSYFLVIYQDLGIYMQLYTRAGLSNRQPQGWMRPTAYIYVALQDIKLKVVFTHMHELE